MSEQPIFNWGLFKAYGYRGLLSYAGPVFVFISVKERLAYWGLGIEIFREPYGFGVFIGPAMIAIGFKEIQ